VLAFGSIPLFIFGEETPIGEDSIQL